MRDFASRSLNLAALRGARYADIRIIDSRQQVASVKNGNVDGIGDSETQGFGVRVLVGDSWGFASSATLNVDEIDRVTQLALQIARASAHAPGARVDLGAPVTSTGRYVTPIETDPFSISIEDKLSLLFQADALIRRNQHVKVAESNVLAARQNKVFANSDGSFLEQTTFETGGAIAATAVTDKEIQIRSYPNSFRLSGDRRLGVHPQGGFFG